MRGFDRTYVVVPWYVKIAGKRYYFHFPLKLFTMGIPYLDCSEEISPVRNTPEDRWAWLTGEITSKDWVVPVDNGTLAEIRELTIFLDDKPLQNLQRRVTDFELPHCIAAMTRVKSILDDGAGFAVLDRISMDDHAIEIKVFMLEVLAWLLGQIGSHSTSTTTEDGHYRQRCAEALLMVTARDSKCISTPACSLPGAVFRLGDGTGSGDLEKCVTMDFDQLMGRLNTGSIRA